MAEGLTSPTTMPTPAASDPGPSIAPRPSAPSPTPTFEQQRFAQDRAAAENAAPRESAPENPRSQGHSPAREVYERLRQAQAAPGDAPTPAVDPIPAQATTGEKHKIGQYEVSEADLGAMMQRQAAEDLKKATLPTAAEAYEAKLPADLKLPGGMEYKFDANDPSMAAAKNLAHAKGWSQQDFSEALGIFASHQAQQEAALAERSRAEIAKVGFNGPQRVDAVSKWITGMIGEKDAAPIRSTLVTDAHLRFYETIMHKLTSQGSASFSTAHRAPPDSGRIPGFDKMSFAEQRFAQDQLAARRRGGR